MQFNSSLTAASLFQTYYLQDIEGWTKPSWTEPNTGVVYQTGLWGGKCGDSSSAFENVQWRFWFRDATLEMYGSGNTNSWADAEVPWITCYPYISKLVVGEGIEYLGSNAFKNCTSLNQVTLPETLLTVSGEVFYGCGISEITLPSNLISIASKAFKDCGPILEVTIPASVQGIAEEAFADCYYLGSVVMESGEADKTIGVGAFSNCLNLEEVTLADTVTRINSRAFENCSLLTAVNFPEGLEIIGNSVFAGCPLFGEDLENHELILPSSLTEIGESAFEGCALLEKVTFLGKEEESEDPSLTIGDKAFYQCSGLQNAVFERKAPSSLGEDAFAECKQENSSAASLEDQIGFIITYTAGRDNWTMPYYNYAVDNGEQKYKSESTTFSYWRDILKFLNSDISHGGEFGSNGAGYYMSQEDFVRIQQNLNNTELMRLQLVEDEEPGTYKWNFNVGGVLSSDSVVSWGGSCHGLSVWATLCQNNILSPSVLSGGAEDLKTISMSPAVESAINYYQVQQALACCDEAKAEFMAKSQSEQLEILKDLAEEAYDGGSLVHMSISMYMVDSNGNFMTDSDGNYISGGHAIVGYGIEKGDFDITVNGISHSYSYRVWIYDCSQLNIEDSSFNYGQEACHLYFNPNGSWSIPSWKINSTNNEYSAVASNNGMLKLAITNTDLLNMIDYRNGALSSAVHGQSSESGAILDTSVKGDYTVSWSDGSCSINPDNVFLNKENGVVVVPRDGTGESMITSSVAVMLPSSDTGYTVESNNDTFGFALSCGNYYERASAKSAGDVVFKTDGTVEMELDTPSSYKISITTDEGTTELPWHTVTVTGENASDVTAKVTEEGIEVSGDNLESLDITVMDDSSEQKVTVNPEEDAILVKPDSSGSSTPGVYEDSDGDGTYDAPIEVIHTYGDPVFTWSKDYKTISATFTCADSGCDVKQTVACTVTSQTTAATCTKEGKTVYTAKAVFEGNTYTDSRTVTIGKIAHQYGNWTVTQKATAVKTGTRVKTCKTCKTPVYETISKLPPTITLNAKELVLQVNQETSALKVSGLADGDSVKSWKSSDSTVFTVKNGKIKAGKKAGSATLTITLASSLKKEVPVTVQKGTVKTKGITGLKSSLTIQKGSTYNLQPVLNPITSQQKITYTTSNKKVAVVKNGKITAKKAGTAKITVKSGSKKFVVKITVPPVKTKSITIVSTAIEMKKGKTYLLKPKLNPTNSEEKITYKTSNKKIASVTAKGKVKGVKAGTATITIKSGSASLKIQVTVK